MEYSFTPESGIQLCSSGREKSCMIIRGQLTLDSYNLLLIKFIALKTHFVNKETNSIFCVRIYCPQIFGLITQ